MSYLEAVPVPQATVSEPLFWTPSAIQNLAKQTHQAMLDFNDDMARAGAAVPAGQLKAWRAFRDSWAKWYGSAGASTWIWSGNVSTIEGFAQQLASWRTWFAGNIGAPSGAGAPIPTGITIKTQTEISNAEELQRKLQEALQKTSSNWQSFALGVGATAAVGYILYYILKGRKSADSKGGLSGMRGRMSKKGLGEDFDKTLWLCDQIVKDIEFRSQDAQEDWEWNSRRMQAKVREWEVRHQLRAGDTLRPPGRIRKLKKTG